MMERGDKLLEISGALEYMQNHRIDDVTTLIENVTSIDIDQTGIKSTFERAIKEGIDYV